MDLPDFEQVTRELVRWRLLEIANQGDRIGVPASIVRSVLRAEYPGLSRDEIHHAVRYVVGAAISRYRRRQIASGGSVSRRMASM